MAAGEGVEPSSSSSKPDVLPVTPFRNSIADFRLMIADLKTKTRVSDNWKSAIGNRK